MGRKPPVPGPQPSSSAPRFSHFVLRHAPFVVFLLATIVYLPTLWFDFTYDDIDIVYSNLRIRRIDAPAQYLATSWWDRPGNNYEYRPAVMGSFALQYALCGLRPWSWHAVNVLLHALSCTLIWLLCMRLFRLRLLATAAAGLFAIHPVHVESVANIVGRAELMVTVGFLLGVLSAHASFKARGWAGRGLWAAATLAAGVLAAFSKEHGVLLPAAVVLLAVVPWAGKKETLQRLRRLAPALCAAVLAAIVYFAARHAVLGAFLRPEDSRIIALDNPLIDLSGLPRLLTALAVVGRYGLLLVAPFYPSPDYSMRAITPVESVGDPIWIPGAVLLGLGILGVFRLTRRPAAHFGLLWMLLTFLVASNLFLTIGTIMAERLLYLPSVGFCVTLCALLFSERRGEAQAPQTPKVPWKPLAVLIVWSLLLLVQHARYLPVWRNGEALFTYMVRRMPNSARAQTLYSSIPVAQKDYEGALKALRKAQNIHPQNSVIARIGKVYMQMGRDDEALDSFERAYAKDQGIELIDVNLATLLLRKGRPGRAEWVLRRCLQLNPNAYDARRMLGYLLIEKEQWDEALATLQKCIERTGRPDPNVATLMARAWLGKGDPARARQLIESVLKANPDHRDARRVLDAL